MQGIMKGCLRAAMLFVMASAAAEPEFQVIFDGKSSSGWILCDKTPLSEDHVHADGLNPHGTSYLVVHETRVGDFVLDFDYKLSQGCNSGVFVRTSDLKNPVNTGIEVALDDTTGHGLHDSGAVYDLVAPSENSQKPAGEWNHMSISAFGPKITVVLNGKQVSTINLDEWNEPGKRPDGSSHKFGDVAIGKLPRAGYFGFQDHGTDCWFKNVKIKYLN
jgi:Domain of Unknown Function (DUF1080)